MTSSLQAGWRSMCCYAQDEKTNCKCYGPCSLSGISVQRKHPVQRPRQARMELQLFDSCRPSGILYTAAALPRIQAEANRACSCLGHAGAQVLLCSKRASPRIARGHARRAGLALGSETVRRSDSSLSPGCPLRLSFALR